MLASTGMDTPVAGAVHPALVHAINTRPPAAPARSPEKYQVRMTAGQMILAMDGVLDALQPRQEFGAAPAWPSPNGHRDDVPVPYPLAQAQATPAMPQAPPAPPARSPHPANGAAAERPQMRKIAPQVLWSLQIVPAPGTLAARHTAAHAAHMPVHRDGALVRCAFFQQRPFWSCAAPHCPAVCWHSCAASVSQGDALQAFIPRRAEVREPKSLQSTAGRPSSF